MEGSSKVSKVCNKVSMGQTPEVQSDYSYWKKSDEVKEIKNTQLIQ